MARHIFQKGNQFGQMGRRPTKKVCIAALLTQEQKEAYVANTYRLALEGDPTALNIIGKGILGAIPKLADVEKLTTQVEVDAAATELIFTWSEGEISEDEAKTGRDLLMMKKDTIDSAKNEIIQNELDAIITGKVDDTE
jgi:hypothetical protein